MIKNAYNTIKLARKLKRPSALQFIDFIFDDFIEFHGDRKFADDKALVGGIAFLENYPVTVLGIQKGQTTKENIYRNFGSLHPEGYRKALRLMKQAEKFNRPIINFINTSGAFCGIEAEKRGQAEAIARNLFEMSDLKTPIISILIGEGGSGGALALAIADKLFILENSVYSILSPEGFASILWKDSSKASEAADVMKMTAKDLKELKIVDDIIKESDLGLEYEFEFTANIIKRILLEEIDELTKIDKNILIEKRYQKFRRYGEYEILE